MSPIKPPPACGCPCHRTTTVPARPPCNCCQPCEPPSDCQPPKSSCPPPPPKHNPARWTCPSRIRRPPSPRIRPRPDLGPSPASRGRDRLPGSKARSTISCATDRASARASTSICLISCCATAAADRGRRPFNGTFWESPDIFVVPNQEADTAPLLPTTFGGITGGTCPRPCTRMCGTWAARRRIACASNSIGSTPPWASAARTPI